MSSRPAVQWWLRPFVFQRTSTTSAHSILGSTRRSNISRSVYRQRGSKRLVVAGTSGRKPLRGTPDGWHRQSHRTPSFEVSYNLFDQLDDGINRLPCRQTPATSAPAPMHRNCLHLSPRKVALKPGPRSKVDTKPARRSMRSFSTISDSEPRIRHAACPDPIKEGEPRVKPAGSPSLKKLHAYFFFVGRCSVSVVFGCVFTYSGETNFPSTALRRTMTVFFAIYSPL
jgi:hypothetical protein